MWKLIQLFAKWQLSGIPYNAYNVYPYIYDKIEILLIYLFLNKWTLYSILFFVKSHSTKIFHAC